MTRISKYLIIFLIFILSLSQLNADNKPKSVPAAPNESLATAKILEIKSIDSESLNIKPKQTLYSFKILIKEVKDVPDKSNFLKDKTGHIITAYCKHVKYCTYDLREGATAQLKIEYSGDEHGGKYWIIAIIK